MLKLCGAASACVRSNQSRSAKHGCKVLIVGGGTGGMSLAWRLSRTLGERIVLLEPCEHHYYQPLFPLVAAGMKRLEQSRRDISALVPPKVEWLQDSARDIYPDKNTVLTSGGKTINYEFMIVAVGLQNDYDSIPGLRIALQDPNSPVCSVYSPELCVKSWRRLQRARGGHAVFTFPDQEGKCAGAGLKIMYLVDDYLRTHNLRHVTSVTYNSSRDELFRVPKYSQALADVACKRDLVVNYKLQLAQILDGAAVFTTTDGSCVTMPYTFLHVTPPMRSPPCLANSPLATKTGYLDVDHTTLQHKRFPNVYGIGDCLNTPNSKTAAAVSEQSHVVGQNLISSVCGRPPTEKYQGYSACALLTSYRGGILAESDYGQKPCETFPFDQSKERRLLLHLSKTVFPYIYWNQIVKGKWDGPTSIRKYTNPWKW